MPNLHLSDYVFAVVNVGPDDAPDPESLAHIKIFGTAFSIGPGFFLTAHHVLVEALANPAASRLAFDMGEVLRGAGIHDIELFPDIDVAIIRADVPVAKTAPIARNDLSLLEDVQGTGYPYALDETREFMTVRAFKDHVVATVPFTRLAGRPDIYELSFQAPRGLSGGPLWHFDLGASAPLLVGMVIGNRSTEMLVFSARERLKEGTETIVERFEAMQVGIAIRSTELLRCKSKLLGGSLLEHYNRPSS